MPQRFTAQEDDEEEDEGDNEEAAADEEDLSDSEEAAAVEAEEEDADGAEDAEDDDDAADPQDDGGEDAADEDGAEAEAEGAEEDDEAEDSGEDDVELSAEDAEMLAAEEAAEREAEEAAQGQGEGDEDAETDALPAASKSPHALTLDAATSAAYAAAMEARGVVYISRIPPYMKAAKLRWLLQQMIPPTRKHGRIGRIFLTPEDASFARKRKKAGGNTGKKFVDGWVEFESKKVARWLAETYNTQPIGGPKRSRYVEDLWTLKYLSGFKWNHLTEKIAYEKTIRSTKIREEISQAKKDSEYYLAQVERSNKLEKKGGQQQKRKVSAGRRETTVPRGLILRIHRATRASSLTYSFACCACSCVPSPSARRRGRCRTRSQSTAHFPSTSVQRKAPHASLIGKRAWGTLLTL